MDKNSIIGIILIAGLFILMSVLNKPNAEELKRQKLRNDSIARIQEKTELERELEALERKKKSLESQLGNVNIPSGQAEEASFPPETETFENRIFTLENNLIKVQLSELGGRPYSVELKEYQTHDSLPLILFHGDSSAFGLNFFMQNRPVNTNFQAFSSSTEKELIQVLDRPESIAMRLNMEDNKYIEYRYTLAPDKYQVDMEIELFGLDDRSTQRNGILDLEWMILSPQQEKGRDNELMYTTLYYKLFEDDVDFFRARGKKDSQSENIPTRVEWIGYKDQFFSSVLMADEAFEDAIVKANIQPEGSKYLKKFESAIGLAYEPYEKQVIPLHFYFGPNKFSYLKNEYKEKQLHDLVTVGRNITKFINQVIIINLFDFLSRFISNYGIIILIMTLIIKLFLLPLTFKSYLSTAKMKVLKPQIDEINKKIPKEKAMERQQATMGLYKKVGVSPLGGCLPMVLQMPILFAMFRFFPTSIELRQESFLWAHDLSTYDAIFEWSRHIPLVSDYFGNHLSLFTLLMTISTILTMKINSQATAGNQQMPGMQSMMYVMPVMFMFILNKFSAGLTYYYFLANLITFGQNILFKQFVDDDELLRKLESKKGKPKKKSSFQKRMEMAAKQRGIKPPKKR